MATGKFINFISYVCAEEDIDVSGMVCLQEVVSRLSASFRVEEVMGGYRFKSLFFSLCKSHYFELCTSEGGISLRLRVSVIDRFFVVALLLFGVVSSIIGVGLILYSIFSVGDGGQGVYTGLAMLLVGGVFYIFLCGLYSLMRWLSRMRDPRGILVRHNVMG
jgi:hypothetical protein